MKKLTTIIGLLLATIGFCVLVLLPNVVRYPHTSPKNACINNLRQIDGAKHQWALEHENEAATNIPTWKNVTPYLGRGVAGSLDFVYCPKDTTKQCSNSYVLGDIKTSPKCKINPDHILP
jgi:hypothetical protein